MRVLQINIFGNLSTGRIAVDLYRTLEKHGYYINVELLFGFLKEKDIPVVWTLHDCWAFTGHCCNFEHIECEKWKTCCEKCPQKKHILRVS